MQVSKRLKVFLSLFSPTESLSFKALILMGLRRKDEALKLMKEVLQKDPKNFKNFTVWHVYGLVYK